MDWHDPEYAAGYMKRLRQRRRSQGLCPACGLRPPADGKVCVPCRDQGNILRRKYWDKLRATVFEAYGSECVCCGETEFHFLNLDHVSGQKGVIRENSNRTYKRAIEEGFPPDLRILCWNCNMGREMTEDNFCPHVTKE